jgi:hypothetical protein
LLTSRIRGLNDRNTTGYSTNIEDEVDPSSDDILNTRERRNRDRDNHDQEDEGSINGEVDDPRKSEQVDAESSGERTSVLANNESVRLFSLPLHFGYLALPYLNCVSRSFQRTKKKTRDAHRHWISDSDQGEPDNEDEALPAGPAVPAPPPIKESVRLFFITPPFGYLNLTCHDLFTI